MRTRQPKKPRKHKHVYCRPTSVEGCSKINYKCQYPNCRESVSREATRREKRLLREDLDRSFDTPIHNLIWEFTKEFCNEGAPNPRRDWKCIGWELMERVREWAESHPTVRLVSVDDDLHAGSMLVFIPHEDEYEYWGTTVVYIPQCTGEKPTSFFLYPHHVFGGADRLHNVVHQLVMNAKAPRKQKTSVFSQLDIWQGDAP